jgi:hypothetical protein
MGIMQLVKNVGVIKKNLHQEKYKIQVFVVNVILKKVIIIFKLENLNVVNKLYVKSVIPRFVQKN